MHGFDGRTEIERLIISAMRQLGASCARLSVAHTVLRLLPEGQPLQFFGVGCGGKLTSLNSAKAIAIAIAVLSTGHIASVNSSITIF